MNNTFLTQLLTEYDAKRTRALTDLENRKSFLRENSKEYQKLEQDLQTSSIDSLKSILYFSQKDKKRSLKELEEKTKFVTKEKKALLKRLNLPDDYLVPHFECKLCEDTGYVNNSLCSCIKQKLFDLAYNKANIGNIEHENFDNFNFNLYSNKSNPAEYGSQLSPRDNIKKIYDISQKFVDNFENPEEKNLMFLGPTGLGKTFLSNCIAKSVLDLGKTVLYQTAPVMLDQIIKEKFENSSNLLDNILSVDLLVIDDLGTETINSLKFTELFNIINTRLLNQNNHITKTIISTNLDIKDLFNVYDERIASRIVGNYSLCRFFGDDIRLKK